MSFINKTLLLEFKTFLIPRAFPLPIDSRYVSVQGTFTHHYDITRLFTQGKVKMERGAGPTYDLFTHFIQNHFLPPDPASFHLPVL